MGNERMQVDYRVAQGEVDAAAMHELAGQIDGIDQNTAYAYWNAITNFGAGHVAEVDGEMAGFVVSHPFAQPDRRMEWFLWQIGVRDDYKRLGIASSLVRMAALEGVSQGKNALMMSIAKGNKPSKGLFRGFAESLGTDLVKVDSIYIPMPGEKVENIYSIRLRELFGQQQ